VIKNVTQIPGKKIKKPGENLKNRHLVPGDFFNQEKSLKIKILLAKSEGLATLAFLPFQQILIAINSTYSTVLLISVILILIKV
jgi:hypothetical protein